MSTRDRLRWMNDQITAALREHPGATTAEVCRAICPTCRTGSPYHHYSRVYQRLRALARQDVVVWSAWGEPPHPQVTTWSLPPDDATDELEALWAIPTDPT